MDKVLTLLGLAYRAKKVSFGEDVLDNLSKMHLLFIASDTSEKNRQRYLYKCEYYNLTYIDTYDSETLSRSLGKKNIKLVGINDVGFAKSLLNKLKEGK